MKSVLFLIPSLGGGGAERVLVNLVNNLDKTKYKVSVQTLFDIGVNRQYLDKDIEYIPGMKKQFLGNTKILQLFSPRRLYQWIIKKKYNIIISYLEGPTARIVSGCMFPETKLISWIHAGQLSKKAASHSFRNYEEAVECYNKYDLTVCVAESVKKDFCSIFPLNNPCVVLYNTNEDDKIIQYANEEQNDFVKPKETTIFSVARLRKEKGFDRLIEAHKSLLRDGLPHQIFVLGEGSEKAYLQEEIAKFEVSKTFHLMGFKDNPYKYMATADLYICPSLREGFSTAVTEALILGIPVVSTCCSGAHELLGTNNEYGIVTENSTQGIYQGLKKVLSDPDLLEHYKEKAVERRKYFSKENTVKAVEKVLDTL